MLGIGSGYKHRQIGATVQGGTVEHPHLQEKGKLLLYTEQLAPSILILLYPQGVAHNVKGKPARARSRTESLMLLSTYLGLSSPKDSMQTPTHIKGKSAKRSQL